MIENAWYSSMAMLIKYVCTENMHPGIVHYKYSALPNFCHPIDDCNTHALYHNQWVLQYVYYYTLPHKLSMNMVSIYKG